MSLGKVLGWVAVIGLGVVIYSQYVKVRREQQKNKLAK